MRFARVQSVRLLQSDHYTIQHYKGSPLPDTKLPNLFVIKFKILLRIVYIDLVHIQITKILYPSLL